MKIISAILCAVLLCVPLLACSAAPAQTTGTTAAPTETESTPSYPEPDKLIALTFDDGPNEFMESMLDTFAEYEGKATFFVVGKKIDQKTGEYISRAYNEGHEIGNHSFSHEDMAPKTDDEVLEEISKTQTLVKDLTGTEPVWYRPPFFSVGPNHHSLIQMPFAGQAVAANDGSNDNLAEDRHYKIVNGAFDGAVAILHCNSITAEVLPKILHDLKMNGYEMVTISELFNRKGVPFEAGAGFLYTQACP